jgi:rhamnulose-1-phosphate aldolase
MIKISMLLPFLEELNSTADLLFKKGWAEKNAGNFSIRINDFPQSFYSLFSSEEISLEKNFPKLANTVILTKARGAYFRDIAKDSSLGCGLIHILANGASYNYYSLNDQQPIFQPTSEILSHLLLQEYLIEHKPSQCSILHTHPLELIIFSHLMKSNNEQELNSILSSMHVEVPYFLPQGIGFVPFKEPGSIELAKASLLALKKYSVLVWERHGCIATGSSVLEAFDLIDIMNKAAAIYIGTLSLIRRY